MTSRLVKAPPLVHTARRHMAAQASASKASRPAPSLQEPKMSTLDSGLTVVSVENPNTSLATVGLVVRAGPRYETYGNQGVSHAMRIACGCGTQRFTKFAVTRSMQQAGGPLQCSQGREHMLYATQIHRDRLDDAIDFLLDSAGGQTFKAWEVNDEQPRIRYELANLEPGVKINEMLHKAAFRTGLGYSLYSPEHMIGTHKPAVLQAYYNKTFTASRMALVGIGVDHHRLSSYGGQLNLESGEGPRGEAKYYGGEERQDAATGRKAIVALAAECSGGTAINEAIAAMVLQRIWGCGTSTKRGVGVSKLQKAANEASGSGTSSLFGPPKVSSFNFVYSDTGLVGAQIAADADDAGKAVSAVAAVLRSGSVTAEEVEAGKRGLIMDAYDIIMDRALSRCEDLGLQALIRKEIVSPSAVSGLVRGIQVGDVQALAKKIAGGKLSMSAYGNLATVPYLDSL